MIGANGAGKTTLFRMIVGDEKPDAGTLALGDTVDLAYVDQSRDALDPEKTVWEEISDGYEHIKVGDREVNSRAYVAGFNFKGSDQQRKVGVLSGGERNRVHLAKLLRRGGNVLLLDEPTNDLDVDTLRALEEALLAFPGCAVIISHDRWFLDRVATHVLAFEGDSQVTWFEGNFEAYEEHRHERLGAEADRPHRITYKQLSRVRDVTPVLIRHFTDPSCPWAFSAERQRLRLLWLYGDQIDWELHMVVLFGDAAGGLHARAASRTRLPPADSDVRDADRLARADPTSRHRCTRAGRWWPSRLRWPEREAAMLRRLRVLHFAGARLDDSDTLRARGRAGRAAGRRSWRAWAGASPRSRRRCAPTWRAARSPVAGVASAGLQGRARARDEERRYTCPCYELVRVTPPPDDWPTAEHGSTCRGSARWRPTRRRSRTSRPSWSAGRIRRPSSRCSSGPACRSPRSRWRRCATATPTRCAASSRGARASSPWAATGTGRAADRSRSACASFARSDALGRRSPSSSRSSCRSAGPEAHVGPARRARRWPPTASATSRWRASPGRRWARSRPGWRSASPPAPRAPRARPRPCSPPSPPRRRRADAGPRGRAVRLLRRARADQPRLDRPRRAAGRRLRGAAAAGPRGR